MKKTLSILLIILFLFGCNSNSLKRDDIKNKKKKDNLPTYTERVWKDYNEVLFLLTCKYEIDSSKVKPLIIEYLRIHDPLKYFLLTIDYAEKDTTVFDYIYKPRENISATVNRLSQLYEIDISTLSSFIYDFKVYDRLLKIEDECDNIE